MAVARTCDLDAGGGVDVLGSLATGELVRDLSVTRADAYPLIMVTGRRWADCSVCPAAAGTC
ncbi:hypothetical protein GCM10020367_62020 [Streptomyces sannanensis]|uniref:Uncharacterized protein n=1 Tax=Streptomyces sannanensis TaxID=285536 RepID=A0ABP6SL58_9ACTN